MENDYGQEIETINTNVIFLRMWIANKNLFITTIRLFDNVFFNTEIKNLKSRHFNYH